MLPLLHLAQEQDGWVSPEAIDEVAELVGLEPAQVLGTCSFYTMFKRDGREARCVVSVCTNVSCLVTGGPELSSSSSEQYARRRRRRRSKRSSASPRATPRRCSR